MAKRTYYIAKNEQLYLNPGHVGRPGNIQPVGYKAGDVLYTTDEIITTSRGIGPTEFYVLFNENDEVAGFRATGAMQGFEVTHKPFTDKLDQLLDD